MRSLSDLNEEDFYSFGAKNTGDIIVTATVNGLWCKAFYSSIAFQERVSNALSTSDTDLLYELEQDNIENILSCNKVGQLGYGTRTNERLIVSGQTLAAWIEHLKARSIKLTNKN